MYSIEKDVHYSDGAIRIRPCCRDDAGDVYEAVRESMSALSLFMPWCHADYSRKDSVNYLELCERGWDLGTEFGFSILSERGGAFLGLCGINHLNTSLLLGNLGYWVRTTRTGEGIATRAALLAARFGFERLGLKRLEIVVEPSNGASLRVAQKTGAVREGLMRNRVRFRTQSRDAVMYSLVPEDLG